MITLHFQLSLYFSSYIYIFFSEYWYFGWRFGIIFVINVPRPANISQQSLTFSIEVFSSWVFTSVGFFEMFF